MPVADKFLAIVGGGEPGFGGDKILMFRKPLRPERVPVVFVEQRPKERVPRQPAHVGFDKRLEFVGEVRARLQIDGLEFDIGVGKRFQLELLDLGVLHGALSLIHI